MPETLLSPSNILLYGRVVQDLRVVHLNDANTPVPPPEPVPPNETALHDPFAPGRKSANNFLADQLENAYSTLARIYAFSYEGGFYALPKPAIFLVQGAGQPVDPRKVAELVARAPDSVDYTGVAAQDYQFSYDILVWSYDKGDFSIRLDIETGPFEQILLDAMLKPESQSTAYSGAHTRVSGAHARLSGAHARMGGKGNWSD
jgi:hypothetical protein